MNTTISRGLTRLVAGPVVAAGIIGGALGLAAVANATTVSISPHTPNSTYTAAVKEQAGDGTYQPGAKPSIPGGITKWPPPDGGSPTPVGTYTAAVKEQTGNGKWYVPTDAVQVGIRDAGPTRAVDPDGPLDPPGTASAPSNMLGDR